MTFRATSRVLQRRVRWYFRPTGKTRNAALLSTESAIIFVLSDKAEIRLFGNRGRLAFSSYRTNQKCRSSGQRVGWYFCPIEQTRNAALTVSGSAGIFVLSNKQETWLFWAPSQLVISSYRTNQKDGSSGHRVRWRFHPIGHNRNRCFPLVDGSFG